MPFSRKPFLAPQFSGSPVFWSTILNICSKILGIFPYCIIYISFICALGNTFLMSSSSLDKVGVFFTGLTFTQITKSWAKCKHQLLEGPGEWPNWAKDRKEAPYWVRHIFTPEGAVQFGCTVWLDCKQKSELLFFQRSLRGWGCFRTIEANWNSGNYMKKRPLKKHTDIPQIFGWLLKYK